MIEKFIGKICVVYTNPEHKFSAKLLKIVGDKAVFENSRGEYSLTPINDITFIRMIKREAMAEKLL